MLYKVRIEMRDNIIGEGKIKNVAECVIPSNSGNEVAIRHAVELMHKKIIGLTVNSLIDYRQYMQEVETAVLYYVYGTVKAKRELNNGRKQLFTREEFKLCSGGMLHQDLTVYIESVEQDETLNAWVQRMMQNNIAEEIIIQKYKKKIEDRI